MTPISPHYTFNITSEAICFGSIDEVNQGAREEIQAPSCPSFGSQGGTVGSHSWKFNFRALNGVWNVYKLVRDQKYVEAAFCCHQSLLDPYEEAKRIVDVANSPYEEDNGTNKNTEITWDARVLVINRYDWKEGYDTDVEQEIHIGEEDITRENNIGMKNSRWLVDQKIANEKPPQEWHGAHGCRLVIVGEYLFGRFGLNEDRSSVTSFLMFTANTMLSQTNFRGDHRAIYIPLTEEQRHAKRLMDGSYLGFSILRNYSMPDSLQDSFGVEIVSLEQIKIMFQERCPLLHGIEPQLEQEVLQLINEALACWISSLGTVATSCVSKQDFLAQAFPKSDAINSIDQWISKNIQQDKAMDIAPQNMLESIVSQENNLWEYLSARELSCGVCFLLGEILELSGNCARDSRRKVVVPFDVRMSISNDPEFSVKRLNGSKIFWHPQSETTTTTKTTNE